MTTHVLDSRAPCPAGKAPSGWFIAGTDTEVGKTFVTCALLHRCRAEGLPAVGMKPVAAGTDGRGRNDDVERILHAAVIDAPRELVNPYLFHPAIAPHLAAAEAGRPIRLEHILDAYRALRKIVQPQAGVVLVEGVGGFRVPLSADTDTTHLAQLLGLPLILVVGLRLGCINHALLSVEAIAARRLPLAGWVANHLDAQMPRAEENLAALRERIAAPLLGIVPANSTPEAAAERLRLPGARGAA